MKAPKENHREFPMVKSFSSLAWESSCHSSEENRDTRNSTTDTPMNANTWLGCTEYVSNTEREKERMREREIEREIDR